MFFERQRTMTADSKRWSCKRHFSNLLWEKLQQQLTAPPPWSKEHYFNCSALSVTNLPPHRYPKSSRRSKQNARSRLYVNLGGKPEVHSSPETIRGAPLSGSCCSSGKDETFAHSRDNCQKRESHQREHTEKQSTDGKNIEEAQRESSDSAIAHP